jgi:hypothetical protein
VYHAARAVSPRLTYGEGSLATPASSKAVRRPPRAFCRSKNRDIFFCDNHNSCYGSFIALFRPGTPNGQAFEEPPSPRGARAARGAHPRVATRRATADRKLRIRERLTSGLSVGHIARVEQLTVQRVRQIIAEMLEKREADQPVGFVQLRIAHVGGAMVVAHTMMMQGDL